MSKPTQETWLERACPVCAAANHPPLFSKGDLRLVRCRACSMVYVNPAPASYASGEFYDASGSDYYLSPEKLTADYSPVRFERELRLFTHYCVAGDVLDVGCSSGAFLYQLMQLGPNRYNVLGNDVSSAPLEYARSKGVPVISGKFLEHDFGARRFNAVCFWAVLEHLREPRAFIERAFDLLSEGGYCFVLVPNFASLATRLLGRKYRYIYPQHLNYFTTRTLVGMVESHFVVRQVCVTHFNPVVIWQDWWHKGRDVPNKERAALLSRTTRLKTSGLLTPVRWGYRLAERLLAKLSLADNLMIVLEKREPNSRV
jgi:2-polyprenyl-3-methyl-5-hydroxy-6-metoxy-1,4-benzoquinol methylase